MLTMMLLSSCGLRGETKSTPVPKTRTLTVFAASSLTEAFTELEAQFEAGHNGVDVLLHIAGSHTLSQQILNGSQADVFASANLAEMESLVAAGLVEAGTSRVFATNMLAVILAPKNPAGIESLEQLAEPGIKLAMAAEQDPAGQYARAALKNMNPAYGEGFDQKVLANVVANEENVRKTLAKVQSGEADAGLVYLSDTVAASELLAIVIPTQYAGIARYPAAVMKGSLEPGLAAEFVQALLSDGMQAALRQWGFGGKE